MSSSSSSSSPSSHESSRGSFIKDAAGGGMSQLNMELSQAAGRFSDDLIKLVVAPSNTSNVLVSPLSLLTAVSMLLLGSRNNSKDQLMSALRLPSNVTQCQVDTYYQTLLSAYKANSNENEKLLINNLALLQSGQNLLPTYQRTLDEKYRAKIELANFSTNGPQVMDRVNNWANESTQGLIPSLLQEPPDESTVLMLLNSVYFQAKWLNKLANTYVSSFQITEILAKDVRYMFTTEIFKYLQIPIAEGEMLQMIELPYQGQSSMVIILPPKSESINTLFATRSTYNLVNMLMEEGTNRRIYFSMPKFKFDAAMSMNENLAALGAEEIFSDSADLSGITGGKNLKVSSVKHAAAIEVDEYGTKAAAVTSIEVVAESAILEVDDPLNLILNRPFAFVIFDKVAKVPVFVGKLNDPPKCRC